MAGETGPCESEVAGVPGVLGCCCEGTANDGMEDISWVRTPIRSFCFRHDLWLAATLICCTLTASFFLFLCLGDLWHIVDIERLYACVGVVDIFNKLAF